MIDRRHRSDVPDDRTSAPVSRRRILVAIGVGVTTGLAGCSGSSPEGGDDGTSTDGGPDDTPTDTEASDETPSETVEEDTATPSPTATSTSSGFLSVTNRVDELEIVGAEQDVATESDGSPSGTWLLHLEVRNNGDRETDVFEYDYSGVVYDTDGNALVRIQSKSKENEESIAPQGEVGTLTLTVLEEEIDSEEVGRVEVTLRCAAIWDGVYCEDD